MPPRARVCERIRTRSRTQAPRLTGARQGPRLASASGPRCPGGDGHVVVWLATKMPSAAGPPCMEGNSLLAPS
jgi:hypothetical protein